MIVKAWSRNITGEATTPMYKEKVSLKVPGGLSRPTFVSWPRKVGKMFLLQYKMILSYPLFPNYYVLRFALVYLAEAYEHSVLLNFI